MTAQCQENQHGFALDRSTFRLITLVATSFSHSSINATRGGLSVGGVPNDVANLHAVLREEYLPPHLLGLHVLGMGRPSPQALLRAKLNDRHALAICGGEPLVRDVASNAFDKLAHPFRKLSVLILGFGVQSGSENGHDHGASFEERGLRR